MEKERKFINIKIPVSYRYRDFITRLILFLLATTIFLGGRQLYLNRKTVAIVNDKRIFYDEFFSRLQKVYGNRILTGMIEEILVEEEGKKKNIKVNKEEIESDIKKLREQLILQKIISSEKEFSSYLKKNNMTLQDLREQIRLGITLNKLVAKEIKENELKEYYKIHQEEFVRPEIVRLRKILVKDEEEAKKVVHSLKSGADFVQIARQKSKDLNSKESGGDLGYLAVTQLPEDIKEAIKDKEINEIISLKTSDGWSVLKVEDRLPPKILEFKEVEDRIKERMMAERVNKYLEQLKKRAKIKKFLNREGK